MHLIEWMMSEYNVRKFILKQLKFQLVNVINISAHRFKVSQLLNFDKI